MYEYVTCHHIKPCVFHYHFLSTHLCPQTHVCVCILLDVLSAALESDTL